MARGEGTSFRKKGRGGRRTPMGLGARPRISDLIAFAVAFAIAYLLVTRGYCVLPWCSGGVLETATAISATIGSILSLIWRGMVRFVPRGRGTGGRRRKRRQDEAPILTVVSVDPPPEVPASAERRDGAGEATSNTVGPGAPQIAGGAAARAGRESPALAPTMWPILPIRPPSPLEPPPTFEGTGRPRDAG